MAGKPQLTAAEIAARRQELADYHVAKVAKRRQKDEHYRRVVNLRTRKSYNACRSRRKAHLRAYPHVNRSRCLPAYGGKCECCGETTPAFLTFDHIEVSPAPRRGGTLQGQQRYGGLIRRGFPAGRRVLCWNCNGARGIYGTCPHEATRQRVEAS